MNPEQLQAMSDAELNELSAVKVMGWEKVQSELTSYAIYETGNGFHKDYNWNPATDMNDAMELEETILTSYDIYEPSTSYFNALVKATEVIGILTVDNLYKLIHATPRQRTIASILAKEETP